MNAPHDHTHFGDDEDSVSYYRTMEIAVRELLIEKNIFTASDLRTQIEAMDARSPARGAKVVARAWRDSDFKARLLANGAQACEELGLELGPLKLVVVENTPDVHNVIVCTLCSCYPRMLLGLPPDWYKSREYRSRVVHEPRRVLEEFGTRLPEQVALRVHDSTADMRYLVLPMQPAGTDALDESALSALVTRDAMIGTAVIDR